MVKKNLNLKSYINIKRKKNGVEYNGVILNSSLKVSGDNNKVEEYFKCSGKNNNFPHKTIKCPFEGKCTYLYGNRPSMKIEVIVNHSNDCPSIQKNKKEKINSIKKKKKDNSDSYSSNSNKSIIIENDINFFYLSNNLTCPVVDLEIFLSEFENGNKSDFSDDSVPKNIESDDEKNLSEDDKNSNENLF